MDLWTKNNGHGFRIIEALLYKYMSYMAGKTNVIGVHVHNYVETSFTRYGGIK